MKITPNLLPLLHLLFDMILKIVQTEDRQDLQSNYVLFGARQSFPKYLPYLAVYKDTRASCIDPGHRAVLTDLYLRLLVQVA